MPDIKLTPEQEQAFIDGAKGGFASREPGALQFMEHLTTTYGGLENVSRHQFLQEGTKWDWGESAEIFTPTEAPPGAWEKTKAVAGAALSLGGAALSTARGKQLEAVAAVPWAQKSIWHHFGRPVEEEDRTWMSDVGHVVGLAAGPFALASEALAHYGVRRQTEKEKRVQALRERQSALPEDSEERAQIESEIAAVKAEREDVGAAAIQAPTKAISQWIGERTHPFDPATGLLVEPGVSPVAEKTGRTTQAGLGFVTGLAEFGLVDLATPVNIAIIGSMKGLGEAAKRLPGALGTVAKLGQLALMGKFSLDMAEAVKEEFPEVYDSYVKGDFYNFGRHAAKATGSSIFGLQLGRGVVRGAAEMGRVRERTAEAKETGGRVKATTAKAVEKVLDFVGPKLPVDPTTGKPIDPLVRRSMRETQKEIKNLRAKEAKLQEAEIRRTTPPTKEAAAEAKEEIAKIRRDIAAREVQEARQAAYLRGEGVKPAAEKAAEPVAEKVGPEIPEGLAEIREALEWNRKRKAEILKEIDQIDLLTKGVPTAEQKVRRAELVAEQKITEGRLPKLEIREAQLAEGVPAELRTPEKPPFIPGQPTAAKSTAKPTMPATAPAPKTTVEAFRTAGDRAKVAENFGEAEWNYTEARKLAEAAGDTRTAAIMSGNAAVMANEVLVQQNRMSREAADAAHRQLQDLWRITQRETPPPEAGTAPVPAPKPTPPTEPSPAAAEAPMPPTAPAPTGIPPKPVAILKQVPSGAWALFTPDGNLIPAGPTKGQTKARNYWDTEQYARVAGEGRGFKVLTPEQGTTPPPVPLERASVYVARDPSRPADAGQYYLIDAKSGERIRRGKAFEEEGEYEEGYYPDLAAAKIEATRQGLQVLDKGAEPVGETATDRAAMEKVFADQEPVPPPPPPEVERPGRTATPEVPFEQKLSQLIRDDSRNVRAYPKDEFPKDLDPEGFFEPGKRYGYFGENNVGQPIFAYPPSKGGFFVTPYSIAQLNNLLKGNWQARKQPMPHPEPGRPVVPSVFQPAEPTAAPPVAEPVVPHKPTVPAPHQMVAAEAKAKAKEQSLANRIAKWTVDNAREIYDVALRKKKPKAKGALPFRMRPERRPGEIEEFDTTLPEPIMEVMREKGLARGLVPETIKVLGEEAARKTGLLPEEAIAERIAEIRADFERQQPGLSKANRLQREIETLEDGLAKAKAIAEVRAPAPEPLVTETGEYTSELAKGAEHLPGDTANILDLSIKAQLKERAGIQPDQVATDVLSGLLGWTYRGHKEAGLPPEKAMDRAFADVQANLIEQGIRGVAKGEEAPISVLGEAIQAAKPNAMFEVAREYGKEAEPATEPVEMPAAVQEIVEPQAPKKAPAPAAPVVEPAPKIAAAPAPTTQTSRGVQLDLLRSVWNEGFVEGVPKRQPGRVEWVLKQGIITPPKEKPRKAMWIEVEDAGGKKRVWAPRRINFQRKWDYLPDDPQARVVGRDTFYRNMGLTEAETTVLPDVPTATAPPGAAMPAAAPAPTTAAPPPPAKTAAAPPERPAPPEPMPPEMGLAQALTKFPKGRQFRLTKKPEGELEPINKGDVLEVVSSTKDAINFRNLRTGLSLRLSKVEFFSDYSPEMIAGEGTGSPPRPSGPVAKRAAGKAGRKRSRAGERGSVTVTRSDVIAVHRALEKAVERVKAVPDFFTKLGTFDKKWVPMIQYARKYPGITEEKLQDAFPKELGRRPMHALYLVQRARLVLPKQGQIQQLSLPALRNLRKRLTSERKVKSLWADKEGRRNRVEFAAFMAEQAARLRQYISRADPEALDRLRDELGPVWNDLPLAFPWITQAVRAAKATKKTSRELEKKAIAGLAEGQYSRRTFLKAVPATPVVGPALAGAAVLQAIQAEMVGKFPGASRVRVSQGRVLTNTYPGKTVQVKHGVLRTDIVAADEIDPGTGKRKLWMIDPGRPGKTLEEIQENIKAKIPPGMPESIRHGNFETINVTRVAVSGEAGETDVLLRGKPKDLIGMSRRELESRVVEDSSSGRGPLTSLDDSYIISDAAASSLGEAIEAGATEILRKAATKTLEHVDTRIKQLEAKKPENRQKVNTEKADEISRVFGVPELAWA